MASLFYEGLNYLWNHSVLIITTTVITFIITFALIMQHEKKMRKAYYLQGFRANIENSLRIDKEKERFKTRGHWHHPEIVDSPLYDPNCKACLKV